MSSALPEDLSLWTYDTIVAVVEQHEFEPGEFDYKGVLNPPGGSSEFLLSVQKTACSLANTMDGFILFGVRDPKEEVAQARDRIVGIPVGDSRKDFGEKMQGIQPEPHFESSPRPILLPTDASKGLFVVRIPLSPRRPHMVRSTGAFYKRSDGGSAVRMDVYEVRDQMIGTEERWRKLTLLRLELLGYREAAANIRRGHSKPYETYTRFDTQAFKVLIGDVVTLLPADTDSIRRVLAVPAEASEINQLLDEARQLNWEGKLAYAGREQGYINTIHEKVGKFEVQCKALETELDHEPGPLGARKAVA